MTRKSLASKDNPLRATRRNAQMRIRSKHRDNCTVYTLYTPLLQSRTGMYVVSKHRLWVLGTTGLLSPYEHELPQSFDQK